MKRLLRPAERERSSLASPVNHKTADHVVKLTNCPNQIVIKLLSPGEFEVDEIKNSSHALYRWETRPIFANKARRNVGTSFSNGFVCRMRGIIVKYWIFRAFRIFQRCIANL